MGGIRLVFPSESEMGTPQKSCKRPAEAPTAFELCAGGVESEPRRLGRRLILRFFSRVKPELNAAEFHYSAGARKFAYLKQRDNKGFSFTWTKVPQAWSLLFLEYLCAGLEGRAESFNFPGSRYGSLAAALGYAIAKNSGKIYDLFTEYPPEGGEVPCVQKVFNWSNLEGKEDNERRIMVRSDFLPSDCVEVHWEADQIFEPAEIRALSELIRKAWGLEPSAQLVWQAGKQRGQESPKPLQRPKQQELLAQPTKVEPKLPAEPVPSPPAEPSKLSKLLAEELGLALKSLREQSTAKPAIEKPATPPDNQRPPEPEYPPPPPIDPRLFTVPETGGYWPDEAPLIELPGDEITHTWTLKHAFEGILILGRTGSGKTSGSGFTFAEAFLRAGFGGLVLTVKKNEAEHWRRLCSHYGREDDLVVVRRGGDWKLNVLAYEAQHPGQGAGLSENLTTFCRNLLRISSRSQGREHTRTGLDHRRRPASECHL